MKKLVICTHPNASLKISGVVFVKNERGVITPEPVDESIAAKFAGIPDFEFVDVPDAPPIVAKVTARQGKISAGNGATDLLK